MRAEHGILSMTPLHATDRPMPLPAGYVLWIAATSDGEVYTCNTQDDGYAGTLENKRKPNDAKELGREGPEYMPGQVGAGGAVMV